MNQIDWNEDYEGKKACLSDLLAGQKVIYLRSAYGAAIRI